MVEALLAGAAPVAFCATRPPGHHARVDTTSGFCLFNHIAVASRHALDSLGARRVFIFDWDVHHGDGTNDIFRATDAVLFASIHQSRIFPGTGPLTDQGARAGEGYSINLPMEKGSFEDAWFSMLEHVVIPAAEEFQPDLVLISAGYDAHRDDEQGGCELEASSFAEMARYIRGLGERTGAPVGAVLEGGYALEALAASVCATMEALAGDQPAGLHCPRLLHRSSRIPRRLSLETVNERDLAGGPLSDVGQQAKAGQVMGWCDSAGRVSPDGSLRLLSDSNVVLDEETQRVMHLAALPGQRAASDPGGGALPTAAESSTTQPSPRRYAACPPRWSSWASGVVMWWQSCFRTASTW